LATSVIAYVEARAAFARKRQDGGLIPEDYRRVVRSLDDDWHQYVRLGVGEPLLREAAGLSEVHRLRAYDAIHLASAKLMRDRVRDDVVFASWDSELEAAARREGFNLLRTRRR
jgi:predicted nucleic acid-binding protein